MNPTNWGGTAPVPGDDLFFPNGAASLTNTNDFPAGTTFHSIFINSGGYTLNGNTIVLGSSIKGDFAGTSTINIPFQLAPSGFTAGFEQVNGTLLFAGNIDLNGRELTITPFPGSVTISGAISGTGPTVSILKGDSGDLTLSGNNTFTGQVFVSGSGRLLVSGPNGLGFADNTLANGTIVGDGATLAVVGVTIPNEYIHPHGSGVSGNGALQSPVAGGAINGTVDLSGLSAMNVVAPGSLAFNGLLTGAGGFAMGGDGLYIINSSGNNFTGFVAWGATGLSTSTLRLGTSNALPSTVGFEVPGGALFDVNGQTQSIRTLGGAGNVALGSGGQLTITAASGTFSGGVSGSGTITLSAFGTAVWTGASTYTGSWSHIDGEFDLAGGSLTAPFTQSAGIFGMASNATAGAVTINSGVFWPGRNGTGIVNTGNLTLAAPDTYTEPINGPSSTSYGNVHVTGTVNLGGATLNLQGSASGVFDGTTFVIIANDGTDPIVGTFAGLPEGKRITGGPGGLDYKITYVGGTGNDVVLTALAPGSIPALDPRASIALGLALAAVALFTLRR